MKPTTTPAKSAHITLRANGGTLNLQATLKKDGTVTTTVTTRDADKKTSRGMSETHPDMATAKARMTALATAAEKLGWQKRQVFVGRPDAFAKLPAPPKVSA